jgi:hypothetical protein
LHLTHRRYTIYILKAPLNIPGKKEESKQERKKEKSMEDYNHRKNRLFQDKFPENSPVTQ